MIYILQSLRLLVFILCVSIPQGIGGFFFGFVGSFCVTTALRMQEPVRASLFCGGIIGGMVGLYSLFYIAKAVRVSLTGEENDKNACEDDGETRT